MKRHSRIAAHPRPVNNETPLASAKHDPNSPTDRAVKLLSVDEGGLAQGLTLDDAHPQHSFATYSGRRSTAMKNPSVPWRAGVRRSDSSLPSAEAGGSLPTPAVHASRQGNVAKPG